MCLAIPVEVVEVGSSDSGEWANVNLGGVTKKISLALVDGVMVGDYVILHVGYALSRLDPEEALMTLALFAKMGTTGTLSA